MLHHHTQVPEPHADVIMGLLQLVVSHMAWAQATDVSLGKPSHPGVKTVSISLPFDFLMFSQSRDRLVLRKGKWSVVGCCN